MVRDLLAVAWARLQVISAIVADVESKMIAVGFYFTILVPFALLSRLFSDPLRVRSLPSSWVEREPVSTSIDAAKQQG